jgi:hypothetical protein
MQPLEDHTWNLDSLDNYQFAGGAVIPLESGFPRFVLLKNGGEKVRVITVLLGSGYCDFVVLKRNGEMFQFGITECITPEDYVEHMYNQRDVLHDMEGPSI